VRVLLTPFRWFAGTRLAHSLRFRLILLVALATLPALGFLFVTASQQRNDALDTAQAEANRLVRLAAIEQGSVIDSTQQLLTLLARLPETRITSDAGPCNALMEDLRAADPTGQNSYASLGVVEKNGSVFCSSPNSVEFAAVAEYEVIQRTLDLGFFSIGNFQTLNGRPTLNFAAPIRNSEGTVVRAVYASLDLTSAAAFALKADLPKDSVIMILDSNGTLLLRQPAIEQLPAGTSLVGTPAVDTVITQGDITDIDDADFVYASNVIGGGTTSISGSAYIIVALPESSIVQKADDAFQTNVGRLGVAVMIALVAAWIGADFFLARDSETRKTLVSELYYAFSSGSVNAHDELFAPDYVDRSPAPGQRKGLEGVKQVVSAFRAAFPDGTVSPRELLADRDKVVARVTMTGTHLGAYYGMEPTGTRITSDGVEVYRFIGGSIVESWSLFGDFVPAVKLEPQKAPEQPAKPGFFSRLWRRRRSGSNDNGTHP
jgi:predicted ester cyclase